MSDEEIKTEEPVIELSQEELDAIEAERLAEIEAARIQDLKYRYSNLKDHRAAGASLNISNVDLHFKKQVLNESNKELAESNMKQLELKDDECQAEYESTAYYDSRKAEYDPIEEIMHVILDHGLDSPEYQELQEKRQAIKLKYPKVNM